MYTYIDIYMYIYIYTHTHTYIYIYIYCDAALIFISGRVFKTNVIVKLEIIAL